MKNVYEVLRQKELELTRLEKEVEALRVAAPLLSEEKEQLAEAPKPTLTAAPPQQAVRIPPVVAAAQGAAAPARAVAGKMQPSAGHRPSGLQAENARSSVIAIAICFCGNPGSEADPGSFFAPDVFNRAM